VNRNGQLSTKIASQIVSQPLEYVAMNCLTYHFVRPFARSISLNLFLALLAAEALAEPRTVLLVDDHLVHSRPGTRRVLHQPVRHQHNPVIAETKPWEAAIGYCSVYRNPESGRYQAYAADRAKDPSRRVVVAYAESDDGQQWVKPELGLFAFEDVRNTNIVLVGNGGRSVNYGATVIVDPREVVILGVFPRRFSEEVR